MGNNCSNNAVDGSGVQAAALQERLEKLRLHSLSPTLASTADVTAQGGPQGVSEILTDPMANPAYLPRSTKVDGRFVLLKDLFPDYAQSNFKAVLKWRSSVETVVLQPTAS